MAPCVGKDTTRIQVALKNMWYGIMNEFDCKVSSTWSVSGKGGEHAFTIRALEPEGRKRIHRNR